MFLYLLCGFLAAVIGEAKLEFHNLIAISVNLPAVKSLCYTHMYMYKAL